MAAPAEPIRCRVATVLLRMKVYSAGDVAAATPYAALVEALRRAFRGECEAPPRHHHRTGPATTLLLMPAWTKTFTGVKTVTVKADNAAMGHPVVQGSYLLIDNATGTPVAVMDGTELTRRRTAAASALAASYLARPDAARMVMVGAGALSRHFVRAHRAVRPIREVAIYSRTPAHSQAVAADLAAEGFAARAVSDLEPAVRQADLVSCATGSATAIVRGAWLKPGAHLDLAGAHTPAMREADGEAVARASVFADARENMAREAGDLLQAEAEGHFAFDRIEADLFDLCRGRHAGRSNAEEITLFKSCGTAIEDLAAAVMVHGGSL
jgi:ornithine cyclodeaminase/alanine dehydrogenase-like protein (mu-crystallin family)